MAPLLDFSSDSMDSIPPPQQAAQESLLTITQSGGSDTDKVFIGPILILFVCFFLGILILSVIFYRKHKRTALNQNEIKKEKSKLFFEKKLFGLVRRVKFINIFIGIAIVLMLLNLTITDEQKIRTKRGLSYALENPGNFFYRTYYDVYYFEFDCLAEDATRAIYQVRKEYEYKGIFGMTIGKKQIDVEATDFFQEKDEQKLLERYDRNPNCKILRTWNQSYSESLKSPVKL